MEEVSKHLEDKGESAHLLEEQERGHGFTPGLGSGGRGCWG